MTQYFNNGTFVRSIPNGGNPSGNSNNNDFTKIVIVFIVGVGIGYLVKSIIIINQKSNRKNQDGKII